LSDYSKFDAAIGKFQGQVDKQLKQQSGEQLEELESKRLRRAQVLEQMMLIRKSLTTMANLSLGDRFFLELAFDDWEGWPRHRVSLIDSQSLASEFPVFQVVAHDRQNIGTIEITYGSNSTLDVHQLKSEDAIKDLPNRLNDCAKAHLRAFTQVIAGTDSIDGSGKNTNSVASDNGTIEDESNTDQSAGSDLSWESFA